MMALMQLPPEPIAARGVLRRESGRHGDKGEHPAPVDIPSLGEYARPGIYFLHHEGVVVYVGQAVDMRRRIATHIGEGTKVFGSVSCRPCPVEKLDKYERFHIELLAPKYNRCHRAKAARDLLGAAPQPPPGCGVTMNEVQAAEYLGVDVDQVRRLAKNGGPRKKRLARCSIRRFLTRDVVEYALKRSRTKAPA